jgi:hypothetical protein
VLAAAGVAFTPGANDDPDGAIVISWDHSVQVCPVAIEPRFTG